MPRPLRIYSNSKVYHIIFKGIDNQNIFYEDHDKENFLNYLKITKSDYACKIYAYCLMDNHVHLVIKIEKEFLSKGIQSLLIRYAHYFNRKYHRVGPIIQNRFKSKNVEDQKYFLEVCRYVHRNPENAGIAKTKDYKWSSYHEYVGNENLIEKNVLMHYFNNNINEFIEYNTSIQENDVEVFAEYEIIDKITDEQLANIIMKKFHIDNVNDLSDFFKSKGKKELKKYIDIIKLIKGTNITQVARVIRIERGRIKRMW